MMEEMLHELASIIVRDSRDPQHEHSVARELVRAATADLSTRASRRRAGIVLNAVIDYLRGEGGRTGGF